MSYELKFDTRQPPFAVPYRDRVIHSHYPDDYVEFFPDPDHYPAAHAQFRDFVDGYPLSDGDLAVVETIAANSHNGWLQGYAANNTKDGVVQPRVKVEIEHQGVLSWVTKGKQPEGAALTGKWEDIAKPFDQLSEYYRQTATMPETRATMAIVRAWLDARPRVKKIDWKELEELASQEHDAFVFRALGPGGTGKLPITQLCPYAQLPDKDSQTGQYIQGGKQDDRQRLLRVIDALQIKCDRQPPGLLARMSRALGGLSLR